MEVKGKFLMMLLITSKSVIVLLFHTTIGHTTFNTEKEALFKHDLRMCFYIHIYFNVFLLRNIV